MSTSPAGSLEGTVLSDGWTVTNRITRNKSSTGGRFSVGYTVTHASGRIAFMKALDFSAALQSTDVARKMQAMLADYNFERDILEKCKDRQLTRVMTPIADGSVTVPGYGIASSVHYLIFEMAKGDIRDVILNYNRADTIFCIKSLHNTAVGLKQLHGVGIAHQDLKPSNLIVSDDMTSKVGDLGRSADRVKQSAVDKFSIPGDRGYAPLELFYPSVGRFSEFEARFLIDIYHLGSLVFFLFSGISANQAIKSHLAPAALGNRSFDEDLPAIRNAFNHSLRDLKRDTSSRTTEKIANALVEIASELCEPDPRTRGDPQWRGTVVPRTDLQRYISRFDHLARLAEQAK